MVSKVQKNLSIITDIYLQKILYNNLGNSSHINYNANGEIQTEGNIGYGTHAEGVNEYQISGAANTQTLEPIINEVQVNNSFGKAIFNENVNKVVVSENTLPVSYLPDKINELIVDDKVTTLPVITTQKSVTHETVQLKPIIHDLQTYYSGENTTTNDYNIEGDTAANAFSGSYGGEYNYNISGNANYNTGIIDSNGISGNNFTDINGSNWVTTQTTETTTTQNYSYPVEGSAFMTSQ